MKKLSVWSLFVLFSCVSVFAQEKEVISGIGKLKLDSSPAVLQEIGYTANPIALNNSTDYYKYVYKKYTSKDCYLLLPDTTLKSNISDASFNPDVKVYYIPSYSPIESLKVEGLMLKYFKDSLYSISCASSLKLTELFDLKYGKSTIELLKEEDKYYTNGYGEKIKKTDVIYKQEWNTNNSNTTCTSDTYVFHNSDGERLAVQSFTIKLKGRYEQIEKYDEKKLKKLEAAKEKAKMKDLDGL